MFKLPIIELSLIEKSFSDQNKSLGKIMKNIIKLIAITILLGISILAVDAQGQTI